MLRHIAVAAVDYGVTEAGLDHRDLGVVGTSSCVASPKKL